ncbi:MAG: phosphate ABC transporter ATP-binding protein PstB [Symbiobacteriaceae bacterium]|nr:phosphate ABC transporter ATP-binding protein PstB [Symbiobacteriaceae bacterium]
MANRTIIKVEGLNLFYEELQALSNVNLDIAEKEITAFIGPSGCGKTTFLKCINRMNDLVPGCVIEGKISINDVDIYGNINVDMLRRTVGMVFQKPNVFPMSVYDNIAFAPRGHGTRKKADLDALVIDSLTRAGLFQEVKDRLHKPADELSRGQQQRLCIARALAIGPEIILMDEPTSALDPISAEIIEGLCRELKENYTVLLVTHNMQQAARVSDKTAFFLLGQCLEFGETSQVFSHPQNEEFQKYISGKF